MKTAYIICHTYHDMYTQEDKPIIDEVYESKADADKRVRELWAEQPGSDYYIEESELYSMAEPPMQKEVPATMAAPSIPLLRHGRWVYAETIGGMKYYYCTSCRPEGNECCADENQILWFHFCPKCGAEMDKEEK